MTVTAPIGLLGGTFDPVHFGHLRCGLELYQELGLAGVFFVPARQPPHRGMPAAAARQRLAMVEAAVEGAEGLSVDARELQREGPSYTLDTLAAYREEIDQQPLCLIMGADAFLGLPQWHRWREILELAHVIVARRPGWETDVPRELGGELAARQIGDPAELQSAPAGRILPWAVTQLEISSTRIRQAVAAGRSPRYLVPDAVCEMIRREGLYRQSAGGGE